MKQGYNMLTKHRWLFKDFNEIIAKSDLFTWITFLVKGSVITLSSLTLPPVMLLQSVVSTRNVVNFSRAPEGDGV